MKRPTAGFWRKHQFKILVASSIIFLIIIRLHRGPGNGTWSLDYDLNNIPQSIKKFHAPTVSAGEAECRRVMESIFHRPFPKKRPDFLRNAITNHPMEIDCCNIELKLGVEYNGRQHYEYVKGMHSNHEAFRTQQYRDHLKKRQCEDVGFTLIVVPYTVAVGNIENYLKEQLRMLHLF